MCQHKSFWRRTKCSQIFGLAQKLWTGTKYFGTYKRRRHKVPILCTELYEFMITHQIDEKQIWAYKFDGIQNFRTNFFDYFEILMDYETVTTVTSFVTNWIFVSLQRKVQKLQIKSCKGFSKTAKTADCKTDSFWKRYYIFS